MKNIAVLIYDLTVEYHATVVDGIINYFKDKDDVSLFIAPVNLPHATTYDYDYQYWTGVEVLRSKQIDGVIVVVNSFTAALTPDRLAQELKKLEPIPIISISVPLNVQNNSYTCISTKKVYSQVIDHLVKKHKRKNFAFYSAELDGSPEGQERLESFKVALKEQGLEYHKEWIFPGDFTPTRCYQYFKDRFANKDELPFDAILCANDYMAGGIVLACEELGINIPDDLIVFGFDNADVTVKMVPTISTIDQHIEMLGYKAGELTYKAISGKKIPKKLVVDCEPIYRQSCGCVSKRESKSAYCKQDGTYVDVELEHNNVQNLFGNSLNDVGSIFRMLNITDTVTDINVFFNSIASFMERVYINKFAVCVYDNEYELNPEDDFVLPEKAKLILHYDKDRQILKNYYDQGGYEFNPGKEILPSQVVDFGKNSYYIAPVFLKNVNYGYMVFNIPLNKYTVYEVYLKLLGNSFVHSYNYTRAAQQNERLVERNSHLNVQNRTDELTKLLNRRGFVDYAQRLIDLSLVTNTDGCVFFFDLDGLKTINDTYGHEVGDIAIQTAADALRDSFHRADLVGRLSGDEFAAVAPGFKKENLDLIRERIDGFCKDYSEKNKLPFTVSTSVGVVQYDNKQSKLQKLLLEADRVLYEEKKIKHEKK